MNIYTVKSGETIFKVRADYWKVDNTLKFYKDGDIVALFTSVGYILMEPFGKVVEND